LRKNYGEKYMTIYYSGQWNHTEEKEKKGVYISASSYKKYIDLIKK